MRSMSLEPGGRELTRAEIDDLCLAAPHYVSRITVEARRLDSDRDWESGRGSHLSASAGDWLLTDGSSEWTVSAGIFEETYTGLGDGRYQKTAPVRAAQLDEDVQVPTLEGIASLCRGDWLLMNPDGDVWPVGAQEFQRRYRLLGDGHSPTQEGV